MQGYKNKLWRMMWLYGMFPIIKKRGNYFLRGYNGRWRKNYYKRNNLKMIKIKK